MIQSVEAGGNDAVSMRPVSIDARMRARKEFLIVFIDQG